MPKSQSAVVKLKQAQKLLSNAIISFQDNLSDFDVIKQSQEAQDLLKEVDYLIATHHINKCVADLFKKGEISKAREEIKKLQVSYKNL